MAGGGRLPALVAAAVALVPSSCALDRSGLGRGDAGPAVDTGPVNCAIASLEICNANDDDCDGEVDEDVRRPCGSTIGICSMGMQTCTAGMWSACVGGVGGVDEVCGNGEDDNCDGSVDEGCSCTDGERRPCGSDEGACVAGTQLCVSELWQACAGGVVPEMETCNSTDDDCDGEIDEGVTRACGSSVGTCTRGVQTCAAGSWSACVGGVRPSTDTCDGVLDEDCDGDVDEDCGCTDGTTSGCGSSVGACMPGTRRCTVGAWGSCTGATAPATERCNAIDDDCDGSVDEDGACPCPVFERAGRVYMFCGTRVSWTEARTACRSVGYDLIILNDASEDAFFVSEALGLGGGDWWIGAYATGGPYMWVDGSPITYANWKSGQPNATDQCVKADTGNSGEWDDKGCGGDRRYACEAP